MIEVKNISKKFDTKEVLKDISFKVEKGETLAIVGVSGSGKSTILKIISKLIQPDSGEVILGDKNFAMLFQYSALFDSLNVFDNISFALLNYAVECLLLCLRGNMLQLSFSFVPPK